MGNYISFEAHRNPAIDLLFFFSIICPGKGVLCMCSYWFGQNLCIHLPNTYETQGIRKAL